MNSSHTLLKRLRRLWAGSMRNRLIIGLGTMLAVASSFFIFDIIHRQTEYLHRESREEAQALAQTLAANSVSWVLAADFAGLQEVIQAVQGYSDVRYAMVLSRDGQVMAHTDSRLVGLYARDEVSARLLQAPLSSQMLISNADLIDAAQPIQANGAHIGWARVSLEQTRAKENYRALMRNGLIYALITIVLTILFTIVMTRGLTQDLGRLVKAARRIGSGERGVKVDLGRDDELGELGSALDNMTTELDLASRSLRESEEKFRQVSASAQDAIIVLDQHGQITDWNAAAERMFGYAAADAIGQDLHSLLAPARQRDAAKTGMSRDRQTGTGAVVNQTLELAALRRDGTEFPIELSISAVRLRDQWHAIGIVRDITARKQTEIEIRQREEYIRQLIEKSPLAMIVSHGVEQRVELVNQKFTSLFGYTIGEMPDVAHWWPLAYPEEQYREEIKAKWLGLVERAMAIEGEIEPMEATVRCKDGSVRHIEFHLASIGARNLITFVDLTERKRAEQAELEQFKLAEAFFVHNVSCLAVLDRHFNFIRVNEAYARSGHKEIGDFVGRNHFEMYPSDAQAIFEDVVRTRRPFTTFTRAFVYPDQPERGTTYWDWTLVPILDAQGEVEYLVFSLNEVTERKRAEDLQRTAALYARSLIEASLDPLVTISAEGKITDVNKSTEEVTGVGRDDLVGTDFADYFTEPEQARAGYKKVLADGFVRDYPLTIRHKSGHTTDVLYNATVYRNASGELQGVFAAARDITERKQAEAVRTQLAAIVQSSHDAIIGKDLDGIITSWNPGAEKVYGFTAQEVVGQPVSMLAPDGKKDEMKRLLETIRRGESVMDYETERFRRDGRRIDISLDVSPIHDSTGRIIGASTIARDITERKQAERALRKVNGALKALSRGNEALIHARDEKQLLQDICRLIVDIDGYRLAWIGYAEHDERRSVKPVAQSGYGSGYLERSGLTWADEGTGRGPLGTAIRSGQIQVVQDVHADPRFADWLPDAMRLGYGSALIAPLICDSTVIGALTINADGSNAFDDAEIALLSELAADTAFGISTLRTRSAHELSAARLQQSMEATIQSIAGTVEMRDPYTAGHQRRVADLATAIAREMGLSAEQVHGVHMAGVVHDLGKIHIPSEILSKPGRLSPIEMQLIRTHPEAGYEILKDVDFPWPIAQVVYQHHERLDGSGYPRGLKDGEIILEARIMTVADVVEAMASHRPYRASLGIDSALTEIESYAGTRYDSDVAKVCLALFRQKGFSFSG